MRGSAWLIVLFLSSTVLAGCIGTPPPAPQDNVTSQSQGLMENQTQAPDGRGAIAAFNETNRTETMGTGAIMHQHDYWHNKDRLDDVAWINAGLIPLPLAPCKRADGACTLGTTMPATDTGSGDTYPVGTAIADFTLEPPPRMGMIYEGTKTVEVKLKAYTNGAAPDPLSAPNPAGQVFFDYLAANDEPGKFHKGGELKLGQPVKIDIKPTDADMPHQTKSLWIFRIYSNTQMVTFAFNITISLVKGYDVVNWPPHPDLYAERTARTVFDGPVKLSSKGTVDSLMFGSDAGWVAPQKVISWGSDRVTVEVSDVKFNGQLPVPPKGFVLDVHNASSPFLMGNLPPGNRYTDTATDGKTYHFTVDLAADRGDAYDTPYAQYSRWGFRLIPIWEGACPSDFLLSQCQWYPWEMTYTMKIIAVGHSTAGGVPQSSQ